MRDLLAQIQASIDFNLYYVALFAALAIPDICGAIESDDGQATSEKYKAWFDKYVAPKYKVRDTPFLTGEDCYSFRCSLLHQGSSQHPRGTYARILFVEPMATTSVFHCNVLNDALNIDVRIFCNDIISAAYEWLEAAEGKERFKKNFDKFMRRYPQGLAPYIVGAPVIG